MIATFFVDKKVPYPFINSRFYVIIVASEVCRFRPVRQVWILVVYCALCVVIFHIPRTVEGLKELIKKNDIIKIKITATTSEGSGIGRTDDGMAVFVKSAAEGDTVEVRIIKVSRNYCIGRLERVIDPSPDRCDADCPSYPACGGCAYRHITYPAECRIKRRRVADAMERIGHIRTPVGQIVAADRLCGYRNKAQYPVAMGAGGLQIGFYAQRSHRIVDSRCCRLQPDTFADVTAAFDEFVTQYGISIYDEQSGRGLLRHIYCRAAEATGQIMVCAVINGETLPHAEQLVGMLCERLGENLKTVVLNINRERTNVILGSRCVPIYGDGYITDELCGVRVRLSAMSFYQVNREMAERLYRIAADLAAPDGKTVIDLYCGAGTIGLSMAGRAKRVYGVEIVPEAIEDARHNARTNGIANAEFFCGDAADLAEQLHKRGVTADIIVVDPPRKGLSSQLPHIIARNFAPERVVYVSCDPSTLARDCAVFEQEGYAVTAITPVDLFPRTHHVETVALLVRANGTV